MEFMTPLQRIFQLNMVTWSCTLPASFKFQPASLPQASWMIQIRPQIPSYEDLKEAQLIVAFGKAGDKLNLKIQCRHPTLVFGYPAVECWGYWWKRRERERIKLWYPWDLVFENLSWVCFAQKRRGMKGSLLVKPLVTSRPLNRKQRLVNHISNAQGWPDQVYRQIIGCACRHLRAHHAYVHVFWKISKMVQFFVVMTSAHSVSLALRSVKAGPLLIVLQISRSWPYMAMICHDFARGCTLASPSPCTYAGASRFPRSDVHATRVVSAKHEIWNYLSLLLVEITVDSCSMLWKMIHHSVRFLSSPPRRHCSLMIASGNHPKMTWFHCSQFVV